MAGSNRLETFGRSLAAIRRHLRVRQVVLAERAGVSASLVSRIEHGRVAHLDIGVADALCSALGARLLFGIDPPRGVGLRRDVDPVHARCVGHVARRLGAAGWTVEREVPVGDPVPIGWIDVLAFHATSRVAFIGEIKSEVDDFGAAERQLHLYERLAWRALRERGWHATAMISVLLLLASESNDRRVAASADAIDDGFPLRAAQLAAIAAGASPPHHWRRGIAMIDPRSKQREWLRRLRLDGRRARAPYQDYRDFMQAAVGPASR